MSEDKIPPGKYLATRIDDDTIEIVEGPFKGRRVAHHYPDIDESLAGVILAYREPMDGTEPFLNALRANLGVAHLYDKDGRPIDAPIPVPVEAMSQQAAYFGLVLAVFLAAPEDKALSILLGSAVNYLAERHEGDAYDHATTALGFIAMAGLKEPADLEDRLALLKGVR